jgi:hypothetical protein
MSTTKTKFTAVSGWGGTVTLTASCGGWQRTANIAVLNAPDPGSLQAVKYLPLQPAPNTPAGGGQTITGFPQPDITAYCDGQGTVWRCRVTKFEVQNKQTVNAPQKNVTAELVQSTSNCSTLTTMATQLAANAEEVTSYPVDTYWMTTATQAHEDVHLNSAKTAVDAQFPTFKSTVEAITVPLNAYPTAAEAKDAIKGTSAYSLAVGAMLVPIALVYDCEQTHCSPEKYKNAHHSKVDPMIQTINERKAALNCQ